MVKLSHRAEHQVTTKAVAHASGFWSLSTLFKSTKKPQNRATLTQQAAAQDSRCGQAISPTRGTKLQQKQLHTPVAFDRCQLCSSRPKSRNQGNADSTSRGAGLALWSSILTQQTTKLQQKQKHTPVAFDRCELCSSRPKSRNQGNADSTSRGAGLRCGQAFSPCKAPGYNTSSCTCQWLFDRCQLGSNRPKSRNQGNTDSLALRSSNLTQQSTRLQQKQLHTPVAFDRCQLCSSRPKKPQPGQR